jgi:hypothetical protein
MLRKLPSLAIACALGATACSGGGQAKTDAGYDASLDVSQPKDGATVDAGTCGPVDVSGYQPAPLTPPNPPHAGKCTSQEVSDYAQCQAASVTSLCQQFADGQPGQTCRQCIETQSTDPRWGVLVFSGSSGHGRPNIEGCVDDALDQVADEKAGGGTGSCGDLLFASYGCQDAACGACTGIDFDTCVTSAIGGVCKAYDVPVESTTGPCAALLDDAAPPAIGDCYPDPSITDVTQQEVDWLKRIAGYMCGP